MIPWPETVEEWQLTVDSLILLFGVVGGIAALWELYSQGDDIEDMTEELDELGDELNGS